MADWKTHFQEKMLTMQECVNLIKNGDVVYAGNTSSTPYEALDLLADRYEELENITILTNVCLKPLKMLTDEKYNKTFRLITVFLDAVERMGMKTGVTDVSSICYSYVARQYREVYKPTVVFVEMTEPDENGYCNVGIASSGWTPEVCRNTDRIIAVINKEQYRAHGADVNIHVNDIDYFCRNDHPMPTFSQPVVSDIDLEIAKHIVTRINDDDTIQVGRGGLANAIGYGLKERRNLKVHTEILTDSVVDLAKQGVVDSIFTSAAFGSQDVYDYCNENPDKVSLGDAYHVLDPYALGELESFVSINSCLMADLTGQICSEAIGPKQYSCIGGQLDIVRGAARSKNGRSFLCLRSTYKDKEGAVRSNILSALPLGSIITTPRVDVMYVVSEYGVADLYLRSIKDRIRGMISIAHPDFREQLKQEAIATGMIHASDF